MATTTTAAPAAAPPAGKNKKLVIILIAALLLVLGGGGAAYYFLMYKRGGTHPAAPAPVPAPVFYPLEAFTVNLLSDADDGRYLHLGVTLKVRDEKTKEALTEHLPELRSRILLLLTNKRPADLATLDGKKRLAAEIRTAAEQPFTGEERPHPVTEVLFTDFVVQ